MTQASPLPIVREAPPGLFRTHLIWKSACFMRQ